VLSDLPTSGASAANVNRGYGVHMAVGLSIGFLFLGGACYKFNSSNSSVAMLLISMWPVLPSGPSDNRCHLQVHASCLLPTAFMLHCTLCVAVTLKTFTTFRRRLVVALNGAALQKQKLCSIFM
jgi:hypothetical protein